MRTLPIIALSLAAPVLWAQTVTTEKTTTTTAPAVSTETTTTQTTTTTGSGTITEYVPGKTVIVKEESGPRSYTIGNKVVYVTRSGKTIPEAELKTRIRVGAPISVQYVKEADGFTVNRVIVDD